jgi:hypothetical protein
MKKGQDWLPSAPLRIYVYIYNSMQRSRVEGAVIRSSWREEELMPTYDTPVNSERGLISRGNTTFSLE